MGDSFNGFDCLEMYCINNVDKMDMLNYDFLFDSY